MSKEEAEYKGSKDLGEAFTKRIKKMWGQELDPVLIEGEEIPDHYIVSTPFSLSDEAVMLIGYQKIALKKNVPFSFLKNEEGLAEFIKGLRSVDNGNYAVITKYWEHDVPIYIKKENGILNVLMCDSVPKEERTNGIKKIIEENSDKSRIYSSNIVQQQDGFSCPIFALNALAHMILLDKEEKLFPGTDSSKDRIFEQLGIGKVPSALLKLAQVNKEAIKKAYAEDKTQINKKKQTLSEFLGEPENKVNNTLSTRKAEKYKHHVGEVLQARSEQEIKQIMTLITTPKPYKVPDPKSLASKFAGVGTGGGTSLEVY